MVNAGEGRDTLIIDSEFLMVSYKNVYNCILGTSFVETLDAVASPLYLKLKFLNVHDEIVRISFDLFQLKRIYQAMWLYQKDGEG